MARKPFYKAIQPNSAADQHDLIIAKFGESSKNPGELGNTLGKRKAILKQGGEYASHRDVRTQNRSTEKCT